MADPPDDWAMAVIRAYAVFGAGPDDTELGLKKWVKGVINNPEFEKKINRVAGGLFGRKPRADTDIGEALPSAEPRADLDAGLPSADLYPLVKSQDTVWTDSIPLPFDEPLRNDHFLSADAAYSQLKARGMSDALAREYASTGTVVTRDGRNFAWVPQPASAERARMDEKIMDLNVKIAEMERARKTRIDEIFNAMYDPQDFAEAEDAEQLYRWLMEDATEEADRWFERSGFREDLASYRRQLAGWERDRAALPPPEVHPQKVAQQRENIRQVLNGAEWVDANMPAKYRDVPADVRPDHTLYEVLTDEEFQRVYKGRGADEHERSLAFTYRGGNRVTVLADRFDRVVERTNAALMEPGDPVNLKGLTWSQRAARNEDGSADRARRIRYTVTHERGHNMDIPPRPGAPLADEMLAGEEPDPRRGYSMSTDEAFLEAALAAGGVSGYGSDGKPAELVAELWAQYVMHDQFLPPGQRNPSVQVMVEWFDLELKAWQQQEEEPLSPAERAALEEDLWNLIG